MLATMRSHGHRHASAQPAASLVAFALLACVATVWCQVPGYDGYGTTPGGMPNGSDGFGVASGPSAKPGSRSKICTDNIWDSKGKCNQAAFESCARKVVKAWNDGFTMITNITQLLAHYDKFLLPTGIGRVTPLGIFPGKSLAELMGLYSFPGGTGAFTTPIRYTVRRFVARCPLIAATSDVHFVNNINNKFANITYTPWFRLDKATSRIATADVETMRYQESVAALGVPEMIAANPEQFLNSLTSATCGVHTQMCTGPLQQYSSEEECKAFLSVIPFSDPASAQSNTSYCRFMHSSFAQVEPAVHCGHMGKNSPPCRDVTYDSYYQDTRFNAPTFVMGGKF